MSVLVGGGGMLPVNRSSPMNATGLVDTSAQIVFMVFYSVVFLVGLYLNSFTLKVYFCGAQRPPSTSVTVYLKNLAAADFLIGLCLPIRIANYASSSVPLHQVYCNFGAAAFYLNMYASVLFIGYVAANRYQKIVHPLGTHVLLSVRAASIVSAVTWLVLVAMASAYVVHSLVTQQALSSVVSRGSCDDLQSEDHGTLYKISHICMAAIFLLVLVCLICFYRSTARSLSVAQQRQAASSRSRKLAKARKNMSVLVAVFCVCFVPYHVVRLLYVFLWRRGSAGPALFYLKELAIMVSALNICLDPLIYFIFCKAFRAQLRLRRGFATTQATTHGQNRERRSSVEWQASANETKQEVVARLREAHQHGDERTNMVDFTENNGQEGPTEVRLLWRRSFTPCRSSAASGVAAPDLH